MKIYHNQSCSKSRETLQLIRDAGKAIEIINYLEAIPTKDDLEDLLLKLKLNPLDIIRKKEAVFVEKFEGKEFSREEWIQILIEHPVLLERPIVVENDRAVIGRPPVNVVDLF